MAKRPNPFHWSWLHIRLLLYLAAALILFMPARTALEHHFLYLPETTQDATPANVGLPFEAVDFAAGDGTPLTGWLIAGQAGAPVILFCMGNAGNISHRLDTLQLLHKLGVAVFIFNYRGYGHSQGRASEKGTYSDAAGALAFLRTRGWSAANTIVFGRSLGAAIGLQAALQVPPAGLIMESAFTSVAAMGRHHYPLLNSLLGWLFGARYDNLAKISALASPLLLIHGTVDSICPPFMAEALYQQAAVEKELYWIERGDHNDGFIVGGQAYRETLQRAIARWTGFTPTQREPSPPVSGSKE